MQYIYKKKIIQLNELLEKMSNTRDNKKIVFTNGCFDIIHKGHISYLRASRQLGDVLIVGLNSDQSVKRIKGSSRPINSQNDRALVLEAFDFIDFIVIFEDNTPLELINTIKPDIYTKAGDYSLENMIGPGLGADIITNYGGKVLLMPYIEGYSTSSIINELERST